MPLFNKEMLEDLEKFSKIKCKKEEELALLVGIQNILKYIDLLEEVDTEGVPACNFVQQDLQQNIMREDIVNNSLSTEKFLENAPEKVAQMIKVPAIIEE